MIIFEVGSIGEAGWLLLEEKNRQRECMGHCVNVPGKKE